MFILFAGPGCFTGRVLATAVSDRQFYPCSCHVCSVANKHCVREFFRGSPVYTHFHFSSSSHHHPPGLMKSCLKALKTFLRSTLLYVPFLRAVCDGVAPYEAECVL